MKLTINCKGKLTENRLFLILEKFGTDDAGDKWAIVDRQYLYENSMIVVEHNQQAVCADTVDWL